MAYESGTATGTSELLSALTGFLDDIGWTIERSTSQTIEITRTVTRDGSHLRGFGISAAHGTDPWGGTAGAALLCVPWESWTSDFGLVWFNQLGHPLTQTASR